MHLDLCMQLYSFSSSNLGISYMHVVKVMLVASVWVSDIAVTAVYIVNVVLCGNTEKKVQ